MSEAKSSLSFQKARNIRNKSGNWTSLSHFYVWDRTQLAHYQSQKKMNLYPFIRLSTHSYICYAFYYTTPVSVSLSLFNALILESWRSGCIEVSLRLRHASTKAGLTYYIRMKDWCSAPSPNMLYTLAYYGPALTSYHYVCQVFHYHRGRGWPDEIIWSTVAYPQDSRSPWDLYSLIASLQHHNTRFTYLDCLIIWPALPKRSTFEPNE